MVKNSLTIILLLTTVVWAQTNQAACRSSSVKHRFDVIHGHPKGYPGHVVDHICSLYSGGLDIVDNMQYQTIVESKKKDRIENTPAGKKLFCTPKNSMPKRTVFNCK